MPATFSERGLYLARVFVELLEFVPHTHTHTECQMGETHWEMIIFRGLGITPFALASKFLINKSEAIMEPGSQWALL